MCSESWARWRRWCFYGPRLQGLCPLLNKTQANQPEFYCLLSACKTCKNNNSTPVLENILTALLNQPTPASDMRSVIPSEVCRTNCPSMTWGSLGCWASRPGNTSSTSLSIFLGRRLGIHWMLAGLSMLS